MLTLLVALSLAATPAELRCVGRVSEALVGYSQLGSVDPAQPAALTETLLTSPDFIDGFSSFINARFNTTQGETQAQDAVYYAVRYVLTNNLPWRDVFAGRFGWIYPNYTQFADDPLGLGYFSSPPWLKRYAGNAPDGYLLVAAYRLVHNLTGIVLVPSAIADPELADASNRSGGVCATCHFDSPFALDKIAQHLPKRQDTGARLKLLPADGTPVELLDGATYSDLRSIVERLLDSDDHRFWTCRTVFEFLYGRPEYSCEAPVFDACVDAYANSGDIRDALRAVINDASFCGGFW